MIDMFKDGVAVGLGAVLITRDKVEEKLKHLVDEGKITREEARRVAEELMESGRGQLDEIKARIGKAVATGMEPLGLARREDLKALEKRVVELEEKGKAVDIRIRVLEGKLATLEQEREEQGEDAD